VIRRRACRATLAAAFLVSVACSTRSCSVTDRWLARSCTVGEDRALEVELKGAGAGAERKLIDAFVNGPGARADEVEAEAGREYDEIIAALNAGRTYGLPASEIAKLRAESKQVHMRQARDEYDETYRSDALSGLAVVASPGSVTFLQSIAANPNSTYREAARSVLQKAGLPLR
jgi:hypothetical protein